jgi:hypothetical protein
MPGSEQERMQLQELLRAAAEQKDGVAALSSRQGPVQENSEVQRLHMEVARLRERVDALENPKLDPYRGFVDLMSEKGGYP